MPGSQGRGPAPAVQVVQAPVEHGGAVVGGVQFATGGGCLQLEEGVLAGLAANAERWARRVGQAGSSVSSGTSRSAPASRWATAGVRGGVRRRRGGRRGSAGRVEQPGRGSGSSRGRVVAEMGASSRARISRGSRSAVGGRTFSGRMRCGGRRRRRPGGRGGWRRRPRVSIVYSCWRVSCAGGQAVDGVGGDALGAVDGAGVAELGRAAT